MVSLYWSSIAMLSIVVCLWGTYWVLMKTTSPPVCFPAEYPAGLYLYWCLLSTRLNGLLNAAGLPLSWDYCPLFAWSSLICLSANKTNPKTGWCRGQRFYSRAAADGLGLQMCLPLLRNADVLLRPEMSTNRWGQGNVNCLDGELTEILLPGLTDVFGCF